MSSQLVKFKGLNVDKFVNFVNNIDINKLPFAIEITSNKVTSKVHPVQKTFLKYYSVNTDEIFGEIGLTDEINYIRLNMITVKKLKEGLDVYSKSEIKDLDGEFDVSYDEANGKSWRVNHLKFKSKNLNLKIAGQEPHKVPFLPDEVWKDKLYDLSDYLLKFEINTDFIKSTLRLISFEKDSTDKATSVHKSIMQYDGKTKKLCFKSKDDKWKIEYNPDETSQYGEFDFPSTSNYLFAIQEIPFKLLTKQKYTAYLVSNKNMGGNPINLMFFVNNDDEVIMSSVAIVNR